MTPAPRRAVRDEAARVAALWAELVEHHAGLDPGLALRSGAERELEALAAGMLGDSESAVFVVGEEALDGFCAVRVQRGPDFLLERERGEITELFVREPARRRGLGRALVAAASGWLAGIGVARVEVRVASANPPAQAFWRALGWSDLVDVLERRL